MHKIFHQINPGLKANLGKAHAHHLVVSLYFYIPVDERR